MRMFGHFCSMIARRSRRSNAAGILLRRGIQHIPSLFEELSESDLSDEQRAAAVGFRDWASVPGPSVVAIPVDGGSRYFKRPDGGKVEQEHFENVTTLYVTCAELLAVLLSDELTADQKLLVRNAAILGWKGGSAIAHIFRTATDPEYFRARKVGGKQRSGPTTWNAWLARCSIG